MSLGILFGENRPKIALNDVSDGFSKKMDGGELYPVLFGILLTAKLQNPYMFYTEVVN